MGLISPPPLPVLIGFPPPSEASWHPVSPTLGLRTKPGTNLGKAWRGWEDSARGRRGRGRADPPSFACSCQPPSSAEAAAQAQAGRPPSELGTCTQGRLQMGGPVSLHPPRPGAPGLLQRSEFCHTASRAPLPAPGDSPALLLPGLSWERRGKATRPEGRKSWEGGGYL